MTKSVLVTDNFGKDNHGAKMEGRKTGNGGMVIKRNRSEGSKKDEEVWRIEIGKTITLRIVMFKWVRDNAWTTVGLE